MQKLRYMQKLKSERLQNFMQIWETPIFHKQSEIILTPYFLFPEFDNRIKVVRQSDG